MAFQMNLDWIVNPYIWMAGTFLFLIMFIILFILFVWIAKKTHAIQEFKASLKGIPMALFFLENRYIDWRPVKTEAGIVTDKDYGAFIVNEKATYIDRKTKNVFLPFDAQFGAGINMHAAKLADDLEYVMKDEEEMKALRNAIAKNLITDDETIQALKTTINVGTLKTMMNAIIPHNINAKIEKMVASRMKGLGNVNVAQVILIFVAIFGAILLGAMVIKLAFGK
jgi:hypothetical protein